jgi:hypothetical protein
MEDVMEAFSKVNKRNLVFIACVMVAGAISAFAVPTGQVARALTGQSITAACCVLIGPSVTVTEPTTVVPVIVTWNSDYTISGEIQFNLSINGGPCKFYGASVQPWLAINGGSGFLSGTFQWIVFPTDGLAPGKNSFQVCAGGVSGPKTINLGFRTLAVEIGK